MHQSEPKGRKSELGSGFEANVISERTLMRGEETSQYPTRSDEDTSQSEVQLETELDPPRLTTSPPCPHEKERKKPEIDMDLPIFNQYFGHENKYKQKVVP